MERFGQTKKRLGGTMKGKMGQRREEDQMKC